MYKSEISDSSRELTAVEKLAYEDTADMTSLNDLPDGTIINDVTSWAVVQIHNDRLKENTDYMIFVIEKAEGEMFYTSSPSFTESFQHIWDVVQGDAPEGKVLPVSVKVKRIPSKNFKDKEILSCKYVVK